jgi:ferredoxin/flavodoxin
MVLYYSGTGNSQLVARKIASAIGDELVSINQRMKYGIKEKLQSERPFVFVSPVYAWQLPRVVSQWIREAVFSGNNHAYFVVTAGDDCGNASHYAHKLCKEKDFIFSGLALVVMPENYIAMFPVPDKEEARRIIEKAHPKIEEIANYINVSKPLPKITPSLIGGLKSGPINSLFYRFCVSDKGFTVSNKCISCVICVQRCPLNNVVMENSRPAWKGNCTHCMDCICSCPVEAIEYKNISKGKPRYDIME